MSTARPRLLAYSHDGFGLGHLRRNLRIADGLRARRPDVEVLLATGARDAERLAAAYGIACVPLPPVTKSDSGGYQPVGPSAESLDAVVARRSAILAETVAGFAPDVLLVDRHPRGLRRDLDAALAAHRRKPGTRAVLGLRDILDEPAVIAHEWAELDLAAVVEDHYDTVLCYGDRDVYDLAAEYRFPATLAGRLQYTGYLTDGLSPLTPLSPKRPRTVLGPPRRELRDDASRLAVCTLGGGQDAAGIAEVFLTAMTHLADENWRGILITGPHMAPDDVAALRAHPGTAHVTVIRLATDVPGHLAEADAVLCMGGYNTTCEVLGLAVPAAIVPRTRPRQEQVMRASRLAERGLVHWLPQDRLTPRVVADALVCVADTPRADLRRRVAALAHDGIRTTARLLDELLPGAIRLPDTGRMHHALD